MTLAAQKSAKISVTSEQANPRLIAFYLTQFHPTPENDLWWGKGFTEWTNVTKTQPLFEGHYQPHLPSDFGFYDLRVRETRHDQIKTAKQYGIDGFCYHYYWFSGKRILNAPLDDMLADPASDMPFCLCWANENWTRRWDAADHEILIAQKYAADDDLNFIKSLVPFFTDPRYIKIDGAPFLIVYRPQHLPDAKKSIGIWREYCASMGIPKVHIVCALTHGNLDYEQYGFDGGVEFPPHNLDGISGVVENKTLNFSHDFSGMVCQYRDIANVYLNRQYKSPNIFHTVFPSWDNTARTGARAFITLNGTPANYQYWLAKTIERSKEAHPGKERLVFINAWNEWAEGCHLEPDRKYGHGFLEATLKAKTEGSDQTSFVDVGTPKNNSHSDVNLISYVFGLEPRILKYSHGVGHLPFLAWLMKVMQPKHVVELGTASDANSFLLMNQVIVDNKFQTQSHAYSFDLEKDKAICLQSYLHTHYPKAALSSSAIDDKNQCSQINDGSVDILHLNDLRSASDARNLIAIWRPKLSKKAVVLIHNTNWLGTACDLHSFWGEIRSSAPAFNFLHAHGMGVLLVGEERLPLLLNMDDADPVNPIWRKNAYLFEQAGKRLELRIETEQLQNRVKSCEIEIKAFKASKSWQLTRPIRKLMKILK
jgi:Glycosyltransferase WbsX